jgi:hypothetical protein
MSDRTPFNFYAGKMNVHSMLNNYTPAWIIHLLASQPARCPQKQLLLSTTALGDLMKMHLLI